VVSGSLFSGAYHPTHASLIVDTTFNEMKVRIAIAGDSVISCSYFLAGRIWKYNADFYNEEIARKSMSMLSNNADIIYPGHGVPFMSFNNEK